MPKRRPRPSQTPPKWSPRPSQIHFLKHFVAFFLPFKICIEFSSFFPWFFVDFFKLEPLILLIFPRENAIFYKIGIFKKNPKNLWKIFPKSFQNPPKILPKSMKIRKKSKKMQEKCHDDLRRPKKPKKMRKITPKDPTWLQKRPIVIVRRPPRTLLQKGRSPPTEGLWGELC